MCCYNMIWSCVVLFCLGVLMFVVGLCYVKLSYWYRVYFFFFKQKTAYEMRISDWSSDVCSSDLPRAGSVAKIVKLEHAWRRLDGRNDDGFQVAPFPG